VPPFEIRPADPDDAALLADLGARTFRETFEGICSPQDLEQFLEDTYSEAKQRAELVDPARPAWVLELEGIPAGFLQLRLGHREPWVTGQHPVELQRIYVLRALQARGLGAALMRTALDQARSWGADFLWLGVWEHNEKALAFYARHGFHEAGDHVFRIGQQLDRDLILVKELP
jgi:ribosomal protein S18 acetylase RimI-like enzyme